MFDRHEFRFSFPDDEHLALLGAAQCDFSSNCGLIIEGILKMNPKESWKACSIGSGSNIRWEGGLMIT